MTEARDHEIVKPSAQDGDTGPYAPFSFAFGHAVGAVPTRSTLLQRKAEHRKVREIASQELRTERSNTETHRRLFRVVQDSVVEENLLEQQLETKFIPQHGGGQLISPRSFFVSPLFRVCSKTVERATAVTVEMTSERQGTVLKYTGPELRQSDALVFMALLNLARDAQVGCLVSFSAEDMCRATFGRYDGKSRALLKEHVQRLQRGLVEFGSTSVQLCQRFHFPSRGLWSAALDPDIVLLFKNSMSVWVDFGRRRALPEGLTSWLYGFVESQSKLIPMPQDKLQQLCGSESEPESFARMLRRSLNELEAANVIDPGWSVARGQLRWRKASRASSEQRPADVLKLPA